MENVKSYLYYGYLPNSMKSHELKNFLFLNENNIKDKKYIADITDNNNEKALIQQGINALKAPYQNLPTNSTHVLPLSGGLDSRAILGCLLEAGLKDQIVTVSFGTPGALDYEIGHYVAKEMGVPHEKVDLTQIKINQGDLINVIKHGGSWTYLLDAFYNRLLVNQFGKDATYWSGYMGEALTGAHLPKEKSKTWDEAKQYFCKRNRWTRSLNVLPEGITPESFLPEKPLMNQDIISYDEQLDFAVRQHACIKKIVLPSGYNYQTPFLHPEWVSFILNVPRKYRENQWLYKEILKTAFPKLFSLPTKTNIGLPLDAPQWQRLIRRVDLRARAAARRFLPGSSLDRNPMLNYIDFDGGLRSRLDLKEIVYDNIQDLKKRGTVDWIDMDSIWERHQQRKGNYADALLVLTSLEINLKVEDEQREEDRSC
ncbi:asparagine synthase-related protein [Heliorestis acidaminivorans]|nr:asparagine synthase-related protein [Heliorestis acidaminivorans]